MTASSFLSYGGVLKVARCDGTSLNNANSAVGYASTGSAKVKNYDDYNDNWSGEGVAFNYVSKNPGTWANELKICQIDDFADQTVGIATTNVSAWCSVGYGVTKAITSTAVAGIGTTNSFTGYLKGIVTGVSTDATNSVSTVDIKITSRVSSAGTETSIDYAEGNAVNSFIKDDTAFFVNNSGVNTGPSGANASAGINADSISDWYDNQTLGLVNSVVYWKSIAPKPGTTPYVNNRSGKNDAMPVSYTHLTLPTICSV